MTVQGYRLTDLDGPTLGLIALHVDETIETEFRRLFDPCAVRLHVSRVPSGTSLTPDTIAAMRADLPAAARLLPPAADLGAVGYACTSGTALLGAGTVHALLRDACAARHATDPLTAAGAAMAALGVRRVGLVTPYIDAVARPLAQAFAALGVEVADTLSFGEAQEARVARIDPASTVQAARALAARADLDALFLSCTNLRTLDILPALERDLGVPVLGSNLCLAWHMARLAGAPLSGIDSLRIATV